MAMDRGDRQSRRSDRTNRQGRQPRNTGGVPPSTPSRPRRVSRAQREAQRQRRLYIGLGIAGALVVLTLLAGATWEYLVKPNQVLATVNDVRIKRKDYWKYRSVELISQISQYQQFAGMSQGDQ